MPTRQGWLDILDLTLLDFFFMKKITKIIDEFNFMIILIRIYKVLMYDYFV